MLFLYDCSEQTSKILLSSKRLQMNKKMKSGNPLTNTERGFCYAETKKENGTK